MRQFTKLYAQRVKTRFEYLCEQFARDNGLILDSSSLRFGEDLKFSVTFVSEENQKEIWLSWVQYFKNNYTLALYEGKNFSDEKGNRYSVTGKINSGNSKFKIGVVNVISRKECYYTPEGLAKLLQKEVV